MALPDQLHNTLGLPVVVAPMFLVSNPELVLAACRAGALGSFPALNLRDSAGYEAWLIQLREGIQKAKEQGEDVAPYAVNLIVHKSNERLAADLELTVKYQVPVVITSLGISQEVIDAVQSYGGIVFHDVTTLRFAEKALMAGVDGVVAVCAGAGGHAGTYNPLAFITELRSMTDKTILAAGCISNGASILAAQACGADLAYMGTRFLVAEQSNTSPAYRDMVVESSAKDIVYTSKISGLPASFLAPSLVTAGIDITTLTMPDMDVAEEVADGPRAWVDIWSAGQGVGCIDSVAGVGQICSQLKSEYQVAGQALAEQRSLFSQLST